jgi:hypothetical protein
LCGLASEGVPQAAASKRLADKIKTFLEIFDVMEFSYSS